MSSQTDHQSQNILCPNGAGGFAPVRLLRASASLASLMVALFAATPASAACTGPAGNAGDVAYSSVQNVMAYCNGTAWISMGGGTGVSFGTLTTGSFCTATSGTQIACTTAGINLATQVTGVLSGTYGGTGVNNGAFTLTLGGNLATSGANNVTFTTTGPTNVTLPTSGTLVGGSGTANYTARWTGAATLGSGVLTDTGVFVGIGSLTPIVSLDLSQRKDAIALPIGNTSDRPTGANLTAGELRYNSSTGLEFYTGTVWQTVMSSSGGVITSGTWNGSIIDPAYGGTGVNNGTYTITLGGAISTAGAFSTSGAYPLTLTLTGATNVTLPTSGTLITSAVTSLPSLTGVGTITSGTWNGTIISPTYGGTGVNNGANTITLGGNLVTSGGAITLSTSGGSNVTLPASGMLVSDTVTTLSNLSSIGTITSGTWHGTAITVPYGGTGLTTLTSNVIYKGNGTGNLLPSSLTDDGTIITATENIDATNKGFVTEIANDATTGTTLAKLIKLTTSGAAIVTTTADTDGIIGVVVGGAGKTGNAQIAISGQANCVFDGATTAGDYVTISNTTAGDCKDAGATRSSTSQTIGQVLTTNAAAGTYPVALGLSPSGGSMGATTGTGTANYVARWTSSTALGTGVLYDNGTKVSIGTTTATELFSVLGTASASVPVASINSGTISSSDTSYMGFNSRGWVGYNAPYQSLDLSAASSKAITFSTNGIQAANERMRITYLGNVGIGIMAPQDLLSVSSSYYSTGTASQSGTTVTGVGTSWTASMVGSVISYAYGVPAGVITAVNSATSLTVDTSQSIPSQGYKIYYPGFNVTSTGSVGIGTTAPGAKLTVNGTAAFMAGTDYTTTGAQSDVAINTSSTMRYTGTAAATFYGIVAGTNGQVIHLHNASSYTLTLSNQSSSESIAGNKIITGTGADIVMAANSSVILQYDNTDARWRVIGGSGGGVPAGTTGQVQFNSGSSTFAANANLTWDNTNYRLGIGTATPAYDLDANAGTVAGKVLHVNSIGVAAPAGNVTGGITLNTAATGQMAYYSAANALSGTPNLYVSGNNIGIGTSTAGALLTVSANTATLPTPLSSTVLQLSNADGTTTRALLDSFAANSNLSFRRADTTAASPSAVQSGDLLGAISWFGYGASAYSASARAQIAATAAEAWTDSAQGAYLSFVTTPIGTTTAAEVMRINPAGYVGIGTTNPLNSLQVDRASTPGILLSASGTEYATLGAATAAGMYSSAAASGDAVLRAMSGNLVLTAENASGGIKFATGATDSVKMIINNGGNVGIGTTSPAAKLDVESAGDTRIMVRDTTDSVYGYFGASSAGTFLTNDTTGPLTFYTAGNPRVTITSGGYVGIGTATPGYLLQVYGGNQTTGWVSLIQSSLNNGAVLIGSRASNIGSIQGITSAGAVSSLTLNSDGGNVGIGTAAPNGTLHVHNLSNNNYTILVTGYGGSSHYGSLYITNTDATTSYPLVFTNVSGTVVGSIGTTSSATSFNAASDRRIKENIVASNRGLDIVDKIPVNDFSFVADSKKQKVQGFIAQELYKVYPEAVTTNGDDGTKPLAKGSIPWAVDYGRLTPLLVKAIQELKAFLNEDHAEIARLKSSNDNQAKAIEELKKLIDQQHQELEAYKKKHP